MSDRDPFGVPDADPFGDVEMPEGWEPEDAEPFAVVIPQDADFVVTPIPVYDLLMSAPTAPDPWIVWGFLWRCAKHQGTRSVWATNSFIARGTHMCVRRVKEAKAWMAQHRIIGYHQGRDPSGQVGKTFAVMLPAAGSPAAPPLIDRRVTGCTPTAGSFHRRVAGCTLNALGDIPSSPSSSHDVREEKEKDNVRVQKIRHQDAEALAFDAWWEGYPRQLGKKAALRCWLARAKEGVAAEELTRARDGYATHCAQERTEMRYVMHPATFLGPSERWRDYLVAQPTGVVRAEKRGRISPGGNDERILHATKKSYMRERLYAADQARVEAAGGSLRRAGHPAGAHARASAHRGDSGPAHRHAD